MSRFPEEEMMNELHKLFFNDVHHCLQYMCVAQLKFCNEQIKEHYLNIQIIFEDKQKHRCIWFLDHLAGIYISTYRDQFFF